MYNYSNTTMKTICIVLLAGVLFVPSVFAQRPDVQPFLPGIIGQFPNVRDIAISPNRNEVYFTAQSMQGDLSAIFRINLIDNEWTDPELVDFSGKYMDLEPSFSPDGLRLYFASNRPLTQNNSSAKDYDIWYVERKLIFDPWSAPVNVGAPINSAENEFYPSVSKYKTIFFTSDRKGSQGKDDIFFSENINGHYDTPLSMPDSVNSPGYEFNAFISPDETFVVYTCYNRPGGLGSGDLCISFNKGGGKWTAPFFLGPDVNSPQMDYCPYVDTEKGVLYFTSKRSTIDKQVKPFTTKQFMHQLLRYDNGLSRLYMVDIKDWIKNVVKKD